MDVSALTLSLPAITALLFKAGIYAYAHFSGIHNKQTKIYLFAIFALSIQNISEIAHFNALINHGVIPHAEVTLFYVSTIIAIALMFHLAMSIVFDGNERVVKGTIVGVYLYAFAIDLLLVFTSYLIVDFVRFGYSVTRIPGPLYFLIELYVMSVFLAIIGVLTFGSRRQVARQRRLRASVMLLAIVPMAVVLVTVLALLHFGIRLFNASFTFPIAITYFLIVTAYAIHQHRLFDIQFYIPWSKVRKRKTAFYRRIQAMIAEIADLDSVGVEKIVRRLADTLRCSVALVGGGKPVVALADGPRFTAEIPQPVLQKIDRIVIANEIADARPDTYRVLKSHGVAAIVPFHPHSRYACGWLLLGDSFSEQVYTPRDFKFVEQLFDKMADVFLDKLLAMRTQLADATRRIRVLERRQENMHNDMVQLGKVNQQLIEENARLLQYRPADSLSQRAQPHSDALGATLTVLGRDKNLFRGLRDIFPQAVRFVGCTSSGFKRQPPPDVLLCEIQDGGAPKLLQTLNERPDSAVLFYGVGAARWTAQHKQALRGRLIEVLPQDGTLETVAHKVRALAALRNVLYGVLDHDQPLLGQDDAFVRLMAEAKRLAALTDPVLIRAADLQQAVALAGFMHRTGGSRGEFLLVRAATLLQEGAVSVNNWLEQKPGVLMVDNIGLLPQTARAALCLALQEKPEIRLVAGCDREMEMPADALLAPLRPFTLTMPSLRERRTDLPLLIHYFTLQYNLQTTSARYLRQSEIDDLMAGHYPEDLAALKHMVFNGLMGSAVALPAMQDLGGSAGERTLEEHLTEFEARLIADTLKRCNGNKSQAARMLGLRPNTLHYKLERYGLLTEKKG